MVVALAALDAEAGVVAVPFGGGGSIVGCVPAVALTDV